MTIYITSFTGGIMSSSLILGLPLHAINTNMLYDAFNPSLIRLIYRLYIYQVVNLI